MGTKSFVDAYEQMIRQHNKRVSDSTYSGTGILNQADDQEQDTKEDQDDEDIDLKLDDDEDNEQSDVEDQQEDVQDEQEEDQEQSFDLGQSEDQLNEYPQSQAVPPEEENIEMNFSEALAKEFVQTVNGFTKLCAQIVQKRSVPKDTADKLDKYMRKIKNVVQAAEDSV